MKRFLVSSVLALGLLFTNTQSLAEENKQQSNVVRVELKDLICGPIKEVNKRLEELQMVPVLMAVSEVHHYETMMWIAKDRSVVFVRYVDEQSACLMGMGDLVLFDHPEAKKLDI